MFKNQVPCLFYCLALICSHQAAKAQSGAPLSKGLLWEISGKDIPKKGYLYGTMHVSEKLVFNLSDSFFIALKNADQVALETNHDEWQEFMENTNREKITSPFSEYEENDADYGYGKNLYDDLFSFKEPSTALLGSLLSAKPQITNDFLYRSKGYAQDYEEDTYLDLFIFQAGKKLGKRVIGLETLEGSYGAALMSRIPDKEDGDKPREYYYGGGISLEEAYRSQDLNLIDSINQMSSPGKNYLHWMLDVRNQIMVHGIDSILRSGQSLFSAVGAAHLPGKMGMIQLLRDLGYHLRPVEFTDQAGSSDKEAIDQINYPVKIERNWLRDSIWSAETPGRFYLISSDYNIQEHVYADMSNGAFYAVYRLPHANWWTGKSEMHLADRLDSLIYEHIPGKIFERKRLSTPFPGHEISTRTRRGDVQKYKIFITPVEIAIFMVGGNGNYALGPEASRFINSVQQEQPRPTQQNTLLFGFNVKAPKALKQQQIDADKMLMISELDADSSLYFVYRANFHDLLYIEEDSFELNIIGEKLAASLTKQIPKTQLVSTDKYPTQDLAFQSDLDKSWYFIRLVIDGPKYYLLGHRQKNQSCDTAFFNSFSIQAPAYQEAFSVIIDTALQFQTLGFPSKPYPGQASIERLKKTIAEAQKQMDAIQDDRYQSYRRQGEKRDRKSFVHIPSGEMVQVDAIFIYENQEIPPIDSIKKMLIRNLSLEGEMSILRQEWNTNEGLFADILVGDTNSTRAIRTKLWMKGNRAYKLSANIHASLPETGFTKAIFQHFSPTQITDSVQTAVPHAWLFLQDLYHTDTLAQNKACQKLLQTYGYDLKDSILPFVQKALLDPRFHSLKWKERNALFQLLRGFKTPAVYPVASHFIDHYPDSSKYQLHAAVCMVNCKSKESYQKLFEWLSSQPRFLQNEERYIFSPMYDTLELLADFIPELVQLSHLPAYESEMLDLCEALWQKGLLKGKTYARLKDDLLYQGQYELNQFWFNKQISKEDPDQYNGGSNNQLLTALNRLAPFVKKDKKVRQFMQQVIQKGDQEQQLAVYRIYLKNDIEIPAADLQAFSQNDKTRFVLYDLLQSAQKTDAYPTWFQDTLGLIRSYIFFYKERLYRLRNIDSLQFIKKENYILNKKPADIYFFSATTALEKQKVLISVCLPKDFKQFSSNEYTQKYPRVFDRTDRLQFYTAYVELANNIPEKDWPEFIKRKTASIRFLNRKRYNDPDSNPYYGGYN
jgi:uncharacterized protein YbaP (TraB family)